MSTLSLRGDPFFEAIAAGYGELKRLAPAADLDVRFAVFLDELYGDSPVVREAVSSAVQCNLISLDNPEYQDMRIKFGQEEAAHLIEGLPGGAPLYAAVADVYLDHRLQPVT